MQKKKRRKNHHSHIAIIAISLLTSVGLAAADTQLKPEIKTSPFKKAYNAAHYGADYKIYFGGLLVGKSRVTVAREKDKYWLNIDLSASGVADLVADFNAGATFQGEIVNNILTPLSAETSWMSREGTNQYSRLRYKDGKPLSFETNSKWANERQLEDPLTVDMIAAGSIDPISAMFATVENPSCARQQLLFDGLRLSSLVPTTDQNKTPILQCSMEWKPIAGVRQSSIDFSKKMAPIRAKFIAIENIGIVAPTNILVETRYGVVAIRLINGFEYEAVAPDL